MAAAVDIFPEGTYTADSLSSFKHAVAVAPSDTVDLVNVTKALFIGGTGTLTVIMQDGSTVLFTSPLAGQIIHLRVSRVKATGTTATNIVALW